MKFFKVIEISVAIFIGMIVGAVTGLQIGFFLPTPASHLNPVTRMPRTPLDYGLSSEGFIVGAIAGGVMVGLGLKSKAKTKSDNLSQQLHSVEIEVRDNGGYSRVE